jgi:hypothetical protein
MMSSLHTLQQRRASLITEIEQQRLHFRDDLLVIKQDFIYLGLGLLVGRLLARHQWLRAIALTGIAIAARNRLGTPIKDNKE